MTDQTKVISDKCNAQKCNKKNCRISKSPQRLNNSGYVIVNTWRQRNYIRLGPTVNAMLGKYFILSSKNDFRI